MSELLYQTDSSIKEFEAVVSAVNEAEQAVLLNRTAFYPGGGGQPHDLGVLVWEGQELPLVRPRKAVEGVWHMLAAGTPLPPVGASVQGRLDWPRRYAFMRTHTAMHILCGVIFRDYGALATGSSMDALQGRIDFEFESLTHELVQVIEAALNREVAADRPIRVAILPREEAFQIPDLIRTKVNLLPEGIPEVRTVEIVGLDLQADGGTHVQRTGEVGTIHIPDYKSKGKINKRIYIALEDRDSA